MNVWSQLETRADFYNIARTYGFQGWNTSSIAESVKIYKRPGAKSQGLNEDDHD